MGTTKSKSAELSPKVIHNSTYPTYDQLCRSLGRWTLTDEEYEQTFEYHRAKAYGDNEYNHLPNKDRSK